MCPKISFALKSIKDICKNLLWVNNWQSVLWTSKEKVMLFHALLHFILNNKSILFFEDCIQTDDNLSMDLELFKLGSSYWGTDSL